MQTRDAAIIMGRKTFDSLGRRPLPHRYNIVLSHTRQLGLGGGELCFAYNVEEGLHAASKAKTARSECFIIGGATMYEQFAPFVERYLITLVEKSVPDGDTLIKLDMFGDADDWEIIHHRAYPATPPTDEVAFSIVELRSKRPALVRQRRKDAIDSHVRSAIENGRSPKWSSRKALASMSAAV